jgi:N-methylhydantoinase A
VLGKLDADNFAGGSIELYPSASEDALRAELGDTLDMDAETAAFGVAEVVDENMANAARVHAVENGEDLSEYTMIAFGGAAPLHAGRLCEKLGIDRVLVPPGAGVGSAIGFLRAPFSFEATRSVFMPLSDFDAGTATTLFEELEREASSFVRSCDAEAPILADHKVYMRYTGQGWEIPIALTPEQAQSADAKTYQHLFEENYVALFGRAVEGLDVEITVWAVNATTPKAEVTPVEAPSMQGAATASGERALFDPALGTRVPGQVVDRTALATGQTVSGPAAIVEDETTIILPSSRTAIRAADGCINITAKA